MIRQAVGIAGAQWCKTIVQRPCGSDETSKANTGLRIGKRKSFVGIERGNGSFIAGEDGRFALYAAKVGQ